MRTLARALALTLILSGIFAGPVCAPAAAETRAALFAHQLDPARRKQFDAWIKAQAAHTAALDGYWRTVEDKRAARRGKKSRGEALTPADYVQTFPPEYKGPSLAPELAKLWEKFQSEPGAPPPVAAPRPVRTVADALQSAKQYYGFEPARIPEREFKLRYAREALALGLTKTQVLRVYALETGGQGTAEMQAGINPITKQGRAISTALGYAQLLNANSVDELSQHGDTFLARLREMAARKDNTPERQASLKKKLAALKAMLAAARTVPQKWSEHVAYANTSKGCGIHALNLDGDIGPWLQVVKLAGLKQSAERAGRPQLSGSEFELMNLAGPGTGLEMMQPAGRAAPTPNFFARDAYARNTVVRGRTSAELLAELDKRMDDGLRKPGAQEFAAVFDEALGKQQAAR